MKYIDSEKLINEIERYENTAIDAYNPLGEDADFWHGKVVACEDLKTLITSLQQEQPEVDFEKKEFVGVAESPLKTFPRVNDFECGGSYRH